MLLEVIKFLYEKEKSFEYYHKSISIEKASYIKVGRFHIFERRDPYLLEITFLHPRGLKYTSIKCYSSMEVISKIQEVEKDISDYNYPF